MCREGPHIAGLQDTPSEGIQEPSPHILGVHFYDASPTALSTDTESRRPAAGGLGEGRGGFGG